MSLNVVDVEKVCVIDPVLNYNRRKYGILKGAKDHTWVTYNTQNFSDSNATITTQPPNRGTAIDLQVLARVVFNLAFTGTTPNGGPLVQLGSNDGPRAYPLASVTDNITIKVGNNSVSTPLNQYFTALIRAYNKSSERLGFHSMTPSMQDFYQNYSDYTDILNGSAQNCLSGVGENGSDEGRGGFTGVVVNSNPDGGTTANITLTVTEPIFMSPFLFSSMEASGLIGIDQLTFIYSFGDLTRVWSHNADQGNPLTDLVVHIESVEIMIPYLTPDLNQPISRQNTYPYFEIDYYPTMVQTPLAPLATNTVNVNAVQLRSIPRRLYIFVRRDDSDADYTTTDTFANISQIQINFNNKNGTFSEASEQNLYNISRANGYSHSWNSWHGKCGSVFICEFGKDVPLAEDEAPGLLGNYQLSAKVTYTNINTEDSIVFTCFLLAVNEGSLSVDAGSVQTQIGVITPSDALHAYSLPQASYKASEMVFGGDFLDSIKNFFSGAYKLGRRGISEIAPLVRDVGSIYNTVKPFLASAPVSAGRRKSSRRRSSRRRTSRKGSRRRRRRSRRGSGVIIGGVGIGGRKRSRRRSSRRSSRRKSSRKSSRRRMSRRRMYGRGGAIIEDMGGMNMYGGQLISKNRLRELSYSKY